MSAFFDAFWPNFVSTVLGVVIGLPLAFWTNRKVVGHSEKLKKTVETVLLSRTLGVLEEALQFNKHRLQAVALALQESKALFDTALDYSAWDATKSEVSARLPDPKLHRHLAYHFSRLHAVVTLSEMHLNYSAGIGASLGGSEHTRDALRTYLLSIVPKLITESDDLLLQMSHIRNTLSVLTEA